MSPVVLAELVVRIRSTRLKLVMADAIFRNLCCRNGFTVGDEPLSLKKMVCVCVCVCVCLCVCLFPVLHSISHYLSTGNLIAHQSCFLYIIDRLCHNFRHALTVLVLV